MSFFSVPLSGLNASQSQLQTVSANLANVDTDGYKDQNLTFSDIFSNASSVNGAGDPLQTGGGVETASTTSDFTDGAVSSTGISSNMALSGNGFFVVQQPNGQIAYSRAGDFTTNNDGQLVAPDGSLVMGYPATGGVVDTSASLQPINVGTGAVLPASATTTFSATTNLNADSAVGATTSSQISVYDSLGNTQTLNVQFTETAPNTWSYAVTLPASAGSLASGGSSSGSDVTLGSGTLNFDSSGALTSTTPITLSGFTPSDGAATMNLTWDLADASGNGLVTQSALASATSATTQNGTASATLTGYSISADGTVQGTFSSGATQALGQVAVATVANDQGLQQIGNNLYQITNGSGAASIGIAGSGGRGTITGGSVEQSNVDVASEFSKMIVAQQAYEANAKSVTTFDQVVQAALAMLQS